MSRIPPRLVNAYIFGGQIRARNCLTRHTPQLGARAAPSASRRHLTSSTTRPHQALDDVAASSAAAASEPVPMRKQIKEEIKRRKAQKNTQPTQAEKESLKDWELTIGIEIHAQLNTAKKLFSGSANSNGAAPNTTLSFFDLALPGAQPQFQKATLIPALRAALALNCDIERVSSWDRKHYFHWDQPHGYQITQFYSPFAKNGSITLYAHDGIAAEDVQADGGGIEVQIKQIQMEQDTAKTITQGSKHFLDFNRVGTPLIEIITGPDIHHPSTAAALVRKIQSLLSSVDACVLGMEQGGLRADVNVSVRRRGEIGTAPTYNGVSGLGTRTEIKNLSSFKSIRDAILVERERQIGVLEAGGTVQGETRGYNIGDTFTTRLRGKEGEVDYRYMPDPDLPPLIIGEDLISHLSANLGVLPDAELDGLTKDFGLSIKDALSLVSLDAGHRASYFYDVVDDLVSMSSTPQSASTSPPSSAATNKWGPLALPWVLHELGGLPSKVDSTHLFDSTGQCLVKPADMADLIFLLTHTRITGQSAKLVLSQLYLAGLSAFESAAGSPSWGDSVSKTADLVIEELGLWYKPLGEEEYEVLAKQTMEERLWGDLLGGNGKRREGKIMYWVGKMMRVEGGRCDAVKARKTIERLVEEEKVRREEAAVRDAEEI